MKQKLSEEIINNIDESQIFYNEPMSRHCAFKTGGNAEVLIEPNDLSELCFLIGELRQKRDVTVIGNGENLIVSDKGYAGVVIKTGRIRNSYVYGEYLTASVGDTLSDISELARQGGLSGMEWAAESGATLGGAITLNLSRFGKEMKDALYVVEVATRDGKIVTLKASEINMRNQKTDVKQKKYTVLRAILKLDRGEKRYIDNAMLLNRTELEIMEDVGTARIGPVFGNAHKRKDINKYISELSGYTVGGARFCKDNPNYIINIGNSTSGDVYDLINTAVLSVFEKRAVQLRHNINFLGIL